MDSELLDVVIGVVFVWFLYSLVLSGLNEAFSWACHARAKHLWLGIGRLLDPKQSDLPRTFLDAAIKLPFLKKFERRPRAENERTVSQPTVAGNPANKAVREWTGATEAFASAGGLVPADAPAVPDRSLQELYRALAPQMAEIAKPGNLTKTTKIAAGAFADAVVAVAARVFPGDLLSAAEDLEWDEGSRSQLQQHVTPLAFDAPLDRAIVVGWAADDAALEARYSKLYEAAAQRFSPQDVVDYVKGNEALARAIGSAAGAVADSEKVQVVRQTLETWFDREMERVSAFYRRQSRKILAVLAIPLVLVTHSNTIGIFQDLREDETLRKTVTSAALTAAAADSIEEAVKVNGICGGSTTTTTRSASDPDRTPCGAEECRFASPGATTTIEPADDTAATTTTADPDPLASAAKQIDCTADLLGRLEQFRVGLAWTDLEAAHERSTGDDEDDKDPSLDWNDIPSYTTDVVLAEWGWIGRLLTLVALSMGAQFWYDMLRRLVGIRKFMTSDGGGAAG